MKAGVIDSLLRMLLVFTLVPVFGGWTQKEKNMIGKIYPQQHFPKDRKTSSEELMHRNTLFLAACEKTFHKI